MNGAQMVLGGAAVLVVGAVVAALSSSQRKLVGPFSFLFVLTASVLISMGALSALFSDQMPATLPLPQIPLIGAAFAVQVDHLSALFLLIVAAISTLTTLYSTAYMKRYHDQHLVRYYPLLLLFFAGIVGVVSVRDWFFFLLLWEFMTLCSYFLVIFNKDDPAVLRAGFKYMVMTHTATALMLIAIIVMWRTSHSFSFGDMRIAASQLASARPLLMHTVLALWFIAFATKAGLLPFGDWLPDAYTAAPTPATAAFSGTMTKLGVYGLLRVFLEMTPASGQTAVWGIIIALFGALSMFVGTLTALSQDTSKRLMSFHVIGQMGYIVLAIGMGTYLASTSPALATIALMAGVFHLINNVLYKSLLFLNAGAITFRTGESNLNRVSGLSQIMPLTGATALIASLSIAGLPPFNGFASKWMIYHITLLGAPGMPVFLLLGIVALFISLVTLASFLKFLGSAFLGELSSSKEEAEAGEVPFSMQLPQVALAALCITFGLAPMLALSGIYRAVIGLGLGAGVPDLAALIGGSWGGLRLALFGSQTTGVWLPLVGAVALVAATAAAYGLSRLGAAERRRVSIWHCGALLGTERASSLMLTARPRPEEAVMEARYRVHGLYGAFKETFRSIYPKVRVPQAAYPTEFMDLFDSDRHLFQPLVGAGNRIVRLFSRSHSGVPQLYLMWQLIGLIVVLAAIAIWAR